MAEGPERHKAGPERSGTAKVVEAGKGKERQRRNDSVPTLSFALASACFSETFYLGLFTPAPASQLFLPSLREAVPFRR